MKAVYTRKLDGGVSLINGVDKSILERDLSSASDEIINRDKAKGWLPADLVRDPKTGLFSLTDDQYHNLILSHAVQHETVNVTVLADDVVLPSHEFFDAWTHDGKNFGHDMQKATNIQLERLRATRDALLAKYDGLQARARDLNDNATLAILATKKQQLRDATNPLKASTFSSIEELKAATPNLEGY